MRTMLIFICARGPHDGFEAVLPCRSAPIDR
jgi:hypothetical protein